MSFEAERQRLSAFFQFGQSVDCVVFGYDGSELQILVIERGAEPFLDTRRFRATSCAWTRTSTRPQREFCTI